MLDNLYKPINNWTNNGKMKLQGLKMNSIPRTSITLDENKKVWILKVANSSINATSKAPHASFTLGKHIWTFTGDESRSPGIEYERELKMSGCQDYQYTCNDGQCVSMNQRCNQLPDCRDESDEKDCEILVLKEGYNMRVPPITSDDATNVSVSINLLKLVDIDEEDYSKKTTNPI